ncbi:MAG: dihydrofolate reductase [Rhizobacter sp.]|nr:dihydrofolate reductase [Rhizobacter sp.]
MSIVTLVAGVARNGAIGRDGGLLWQLPEDMAHFKALTMGHPVIMGRKTWDSLPAKFRPLPGRRNLVLSRQAGLKLEGAEVFATLEGAFVAASDADQVFIIGGAQLYAEALPHADRLALTEIDADFDGDTFFPPWPRERFVETARETHHRPAGRGHGWNFHFVTYERRLR